ncbi:AraC family transcriptional regulator [Nocardia sp. NPDC052278]|uniref:AraC family transcriptional regulator n=1 Tax=unclassified Nocardia TaxID=2637762 RepID=UPI0036D00157
MVFPAAIGDTAMVFGAGVISAGYWFDTHEHPQHQIAWAARGVIAVEIGDGYWVLPPSRALWIPGGTRHRTGTANGAIMRGIFVAPDRCPVSWTTPTMLRVSPLLRELFDHLTGPDTALARAEDEERIESVDEPPLSAHPPTATRADPVAAPTRIPAGDSPSARRERTKAQLEHFDESPISARPLTNSRAEENATPSRNPEVAAGRREHFEHAEAVRVETPVSDRPLMDARAEERAAAPTRDPADDIATRERAEAVVFDLLVPVDVIPVGARRPVDARAGQVADVLTRDPADSRTLAEFAADAATSPRTLARLFLAETGISFGQWRTQIRLAASLPLLAEGLPIARIAGRVGYATPSAYVAAFRRTVGVSPGRYFAG